MSIKIEATGPQALIEDLGRPGLAAIGVGRSGAADRTSLRLGNRLVANDNEGAAAIEVLLGGFVAHASRNLTLAITGAPASATVDGQPVALYAPVVLQAGQELRLAPPTSGLRTYICVRGGIAIHDTLGSRSTDTLSGIGPLPLQPGTELPVGPPPTSFPLIDVAPISPPPAGPVTLRACRGPHAERILDPDGLAQEWVASTRSDRIGMRLNGALLTATDGSGEQPSIGLTRGAIQLPPGGEPVVFLADHPVTGGYPVIAVLLDADVDRAAQIRPGQPVRILYTDLPNAEEPL